ncbi:hypothetical protein J2W27_000343 [Variovorax boronicumulans]|uniref:right-handed parallel beta-helix repeat-containing protein n=1 Tax=Variovorax boronicumulans TaxID=436515 RepID=UPI0027805CAE|nr:right-handed parallel beta-helix repeat-containing protein [Variovorax boronicumulans]MDP9908250.1 hypothetical protein [Variovorax boronicumulans]
MATYVTREELAEPTGASLVGTLEGTAQEALNGRVKTLTDYAALLAYDGTAAVQVMAAGIAGLFRYNPSAPSTTNNGTCFAHASGGGAWERDFSGDVDVRWFGATGDGTDESSMVIAALAAHNRVTIPSGLTVSAKNVELQSNSVISCHGSLRLPNACTDFDRLLWATGKSNINIVTKELDGNYPNQLGNIGTHLVYLINCQDVYLNIQHAHDHYIASGAPMPSTDGVRGASTGGVFLHRCTRANVSVDLLRGWGREGIYLEQCEFSCVSLGHAQGVYATEYSGLQVKGVSNKITRASVDNAGASAVGFDTINGVCSNIIATNTRANNGLNIGHPGFPGSGSTLENIVIDGCLGYGIGVAANSKDVVIGNFNVSNAAIGGISFSDGSMDGKLTGGVVRNSGRYNLNASTTQVRCSNVKSTELDALCLTTNLVSGNFVEGESITTATGNAVARRILIGFTTRILFFSSVTGTFSAGQIVTGGTSGATATITRADAPLQKNETGGGLFIDESRLFPGTISQVRFADGTAICGLSFTCTHTTAGSPETFTQGFTSNVLWISAPIAVASIGSSSSTNSYTINRLSASSTISTITVTLNASVNQTYGVQMHLIGRWK